MTDLEKIVFIRPPMPFAHPNGKPLVVAHRGGSLEVPENTLAAVRHGVACGSQWQEVDVALTRDGAAVVLHDDTLERTTGGRGAIAQTDRAELAGLCTGRPQWTVEARARLAAQGINVPTFADAYADETIPDLSTVLAVHGAQLMLELKTTDHAVAFAQTVVAAVRQAGMQKRVVVGSFDLPTVQALAGAAPDIARVGIVEDVALLAPMLAAGVAVVAVDTAIADAVLTRVPPNVAVWTWTVYTESAAHSLAKAGVHGLITDIPRRLVGVHDTFAVSRSPA